MKNNKILIFIASIIGLNLIIFVVFLAIRLLTFQEYQTANDKILRYVNVPANLVSKFKATNDGLERIDFLFKNPGLASHDEYKITIFDENKNVIADRVVSGYNIGDPGKFRIDFPKITDSKDKIFYFKIEPVKLEDNFLKIALNDNDQNPQILVNSFYRPDFSFSRIFSDTITVFSRYMTTAYFPLILMILLLGLLFI
ncbi:hypothetical protein GYA19_00015 [Candidatus Beckwithbacteria bacterium]|nr:hypothetical protein [Candidatus Beckwithbacteria bacterium]